MCSGAIEEVPGAAKVSNLYTRGGGNGADPETPDAPKDVNDPKTPSPGAGEEDVPPMSG